MCKLIEDKIIKKIKTFIRKLNKVNMLGNKNKIYSNFDVLQNKCGPTYILLTKVKIPRFEDPTYCLTSS